MCSRTVASRVSRRSMTGVLQLLRPVLADEVATEAVVRFGADEGEPRPLVDPPSAGQHVVRPERQLAVAGGAREAQALLDEARADAQAARRRLDEEQAQLCGVASLGDAQDAAHGAPAKLGDPGGLARWVAAVDVVGDYPRDERPEGLGPAVPPRVERTVAVD